MSVAGKSNPLAISGLVVLTLIWSYSWIFMKQVTSYIGAFDFTALRCIFGALVLFIVLLLRSREWLCPPPRSGRDRPDGTGICQWLSCYGYRLTCSSMCSPLQCYRYDTQR